MTLEDLTKILVYAVTAYDRELTEDMVSVYFDHLGKFDAMQVATAVRHHVANVEKFPTVADIRKTVQMLTHKTDPVVKRNQYIARRVDEARSLGKSTNEIYKLIDELERTFCINRGT